MDDQGSIGERIRYYRKRRGMPQTVLAGQVGRSPSWLTKVERGELVMDRISVLLELARVLKVEPGDLIGGVSLPPNGGAPTDPPRGIPAVRRAVMAVRPPDINPPTEAELRAATARTAGDLWSHGRIQQVAAALPDLITQARAAAAHGVPGGWWCLANAYQVTAHTAGKLGELKLEWIAATEGVRAAEQSGDALMAASVRRSLALALLHEGWLDEAAGLCSDAADALAPDADSPPEHWSVWGALHLTAAVVLARADDSAGAARMLRAGRDAAERAGEDRDELRQGGGRPSNAAAHELAVALEMGDAVEGLRVADGIDSDGMSNGERAATCLFDVARAHLLRRDDAATVLQLLEAERHAPELLRYSVKARELVRVCLRRERRSRTPGLRALAGRLGVAH